MSEQAIELVIREAVPDDAADLIAFLEDVSQQTTFLTLETDDKQITEEEEAEHLGRLLESPVNCLLVSFDGGRMIAAASVHTPADSKTQHIGDVGIVVHEEYWGMGLGTILMEELVAWSEDTGIIKRLQLQVQERNSRAKSLYAKVGFRQEAVLERGIFIEGNYLPVCLMSRMVGDI